MPTQLQLDGPDLEALLDQVRAQFGGRARILQADRVRSGGIGGFFAKDRYELLVETEDDAAVPSPPPASLLDLADRVSDEEAASGEPVVSTQTPAFADVLRRLLEDGGAVREGTVLEPASPADDEPFVALPTVAAPPPADLPPGAVPHARTPSAATLFAAVALPTVPVLGPSSPLAARPASAALTPVPAEAPAAEPVAPARPPALLRPHEARAERPDAVEADEAPAAAELEPAPVRGLPALSARAEQLLSLGLPEHLLPASDDPAALVESLRRLPRAPRPANRPGQVLAVVGPVHLALSLGRQLAAELGLTPSTALVLAGPSADEWVAERQAVLDVPTAAERRAAWKRRRSLTVVAVDCPVTAAAALRAREFLGALAPCATWVTVEASRKTHDLAAWTGLVGSVDALAVQEVDATMDPASVLRLGIPVARLGPRTATPAAWASLLTSRLAA